LRYLGHTFPREEDLMPMAGISYAGSILPLASFLLHLLSGIHAINTLDISKDLALSRGGTSQLVPACPASGHILSVLKYFFRFHRIPFPLLRICRAVSNRCATCAAV
jgi:hypothetical protein